jgi:hypothetical protein
VAYLLPTSLKLFAQVASVSGLSILDCSFGFLKRLMAFQSFDFELTCGELFQKRVMRIKLDIYVFITDSPCPSQVDRLS